MIYGKVSLDDSRAYIAHSVGPHLRRRKEGENADSEILEEPDCAVGYPAPRERSGFE